jgi:hypothetical protein
MSLGEKENLQAIGREKGEVVSLSKEIIKAQGGGDKSGNPFCRSGSAGRYLLHPSIQNQKNFILKLIMRLFMIL